MADRILRLLGNPNLRSEFAANARRAAVANFDIRHIVRQHLNLYGINPAMKEAENRLVVELKNGTKISVTGANAPADAEAEADAPI
jgi:hypothetical protein